MRSYLRPLDLRHGRVDLSHGAGGQASAQLIREVFVKHLGNAYLAQGDDGALLPPPGGRVVMSTDAHVVSPLFFPGGDIGCLAVHGTINDVAMLGARPLYLSASFVLEEGFLLADLVRIVVSMAEAARQAGVPVVTGDTKVVETGKGDGVFITTSALGVVPDGVHLSGAHAQVGDLILLSGDLGDHGAAILTARQDLGFNHAVPSDTAALHGLVSAMLAASPRIHCLRDPTRGGLATTLNEIAAQSQVGMVLEEATIPVKPAVGALCEFLGLDPLYLANEGKLIAILPPQEAGPVLAAMGAHPLGRGARVIGQVVADERQMVQMTTRLGGRRRVDWLSGEPLPRIC